MALSLFHLIALILAAGLAWTTPCSSSTPRTIRPSSAACTRCWWCSASTFLVFLLLALSALPVLRAIGLPVTLGVALQFPAGAAVDARRREVPRAS